MGWTKTAKGYKAITTGGTARLEKVEREWSLVMEGWDAMALGRRASFDHAEGEIARRGLVVVAGDELETLRASVLACREDNSEATVEEMVEMFNDPKAGGARPVTPAEVQAMLDALAMEG